MLQESGIRKQYWHVVVKSKIYLGGQGEKHGMCKKQYNSSIKKECT